MELQPYLFFHGKCEEALNFYASCFNGKITQMSRFEGSPVEGDAGPDYRNKIMHATFSADGMTFMASDGRPGPGPDGEDDVVLSVSTQDAGEGERIFKALSEGGKVSQPLDNAFWGGRFGSLTDRFGIQWMVTTP